MAELLLDFKEVTENEIIEVKAWRVPKSKEYPEGINYRMAFIRDGKRILGYDNNTFEGHHKHFFGRKTQITFTSLEQLFSQFMEEVKTIRGGKHENEGQDSTY